MENEGDGKFINFVKYNTQKLDTLKNKITFSKSL